MRNIVAGVALVLAFVIGFATYHPSVAQTPTLMMGQSSGTVKAVATDSSGRLAIAASADPCMDPNVAKSSVAVTATGELVALTASQVVYACGFYATLGGTTPTVQFQTGTGSACGTGTANLSGAFAPTVGVDLVLGHGGTIMKSATSGALCIALAGTTPTIAGVMSYVKQ